MYLDGGDPGRLAPIQCNATSAIGCSPSESHPIVGDLDLAEYLVETTLEGLSLLPGCRTFHDVDQLARSEGSEAERLRKHLDRSLQDFDYVLLDFLGDVVCGGFGLPIARDMAQKVILVASNDLQSLYVANNVCSAVDYFRKLGGNVGVAGLVINKDDGTGEAAAFAEAVKIPVLAAIPQNDDLRKKSANYQIVRTENKQS